MRNELSCLTCGKELRFNTAEKMVQVELNMAIRVDNVQQKEQVVFCQECARKIYVKARLVFDNEVPSASFGGWRELGTYNG